MNISYYVKPCVSCLFISALSVSLRLGLMESSLESDLLYNKGWP